MKIGLLAYSTNTGLGYQTLDFAKNISCHKILIADLSSLNDVETHHERFTGHCDNIQISEGFPSYENLNWLTDDVDLIFCAETPLNYSLFEIARNKGVKTVMQFNYEFLNYFRDQNLYRPDVLASPSFWEIDRVKTLGIKTVYLPVPIDIEKVPFRSFEKTQTFVHISGRPADYDRNGATEYLEAIKTLPEYYRYKFYYQVPLEEKRIKNFAPVQKKLDETKEILGDRLEIVTDVENNEEMYKSGEILVLPRKYGGLCLPLWEALSAGMPVIMPDIDPNNKVLPQEWLVKSSLSGEIFTHSAIPFYSPSSEDLKKTMISVAENIKDNNITARKLAISMSWSLQKRRYLQLFEQVIKYGSDFIF